MPTSEIETTSAIEPTSKEDENGDTDKKLIIENDEKFSRIKVEISNQMDMSFPDGIDCTVKIVQKGGNNILVDKDNNPVVVNVKDGIGESASVMTDYIKNNDYIVTVEAPGFKAFEQEILSEELEHMMCTVKVTLGFHKNYSYGLTPKCDENGKLMRNEDGDLIYDEPKTINHPGVLVYGDINGSDGENKNKAIDIHDAVLLAGAIDLYVRLEEATNKYNEAVKLYESANDNEKGTAEKAMIEAETAMETAKEKAASYSLDKFDLNHDGTVNMSDMSYFTKGFIDTRGFDTKAALEK
ncbi:MAG: hypothetical protein K2K02_00205 [Ruminococcus sp.]|nr:hypothetical protein [Ruminococcus sp.]